MPIFFHFILNYSLKTVTFLCLAFSYMQVMSRHDLVLIGFQLCAQISRRRQWLFSDWGPTMCTWCQDHDLSLIGFQLYVNDVKTVTFLWLAFGYMQMMSRQWHFFDWLYTAKFILCQDSDLSLTGFQPFVHIKTMTFLRLAKQLCAHDVKMTSLWLTSSYVYIMIISRKWLFSDWLPVICALGVKIVTFLSLSSSYMHLMSKHDNSLIGFQLCAQYIDNDKCI